MLAYQNVLFIYVPSYLHLTPTVTFSFHTNSSTIQVYEGDMLEVCIQGEEVSTSTEVEIVWRVAPNKNSAIGIILASMCLNFCMICRWKFLYCHIWLLE